MRSEQRNDGSRLMRGRARVGRGFTVEIGRLSPGLDPFRYGENYSPYPLEGHFSAGDVVVLYRKTDFAKFYHRPSGLTLEVQWTEDGSTEHGLHLPHFVEGGKFENGIWISVLPSLNPERRVGISRVARYPDGNLRWAADPHNRGSLTPLREKWAEFSESEDGWSGLLPLHAKGVTAEAIHVKFTEESAHVSRLRGRG